MGINKDLNIDPYFENFYDPVNPQYKQYNKILFRPARAIQARELTQMQTILQEQIERFGSNVYQEGTIIRGVNPTERRDIRYIKVRDTEDLPDPTIYVPSTVYDADLQEDVTTEYMLIGRNKGLRAKIVTASNGFQTRDPDLKTFYISYLNASFDADADEDVKQFIDGETLEIHEIDPQDPSQTTLVNTTVVASVDNYAGRSYACAVSDGIIFQKGHFIQVDKQLIIVEKYSNIPQDTSIGFRVDELIITSNQDETLLDNAQGYNNDNAPGADRLQLQPILVSYKLDSEERPENFFALITIERGQSITNRDVTQFNSISKAMARRTFEESGNYVTRGLKLSLEEDADGKYAVVNPGKAYVNGYEVELRGKKYLPIESGFDANGNYISDTISIDNQITTADYGQYFEFNYEGIVDNGDGTYTGTVLDRFEMDGTVHYLYDNANNQIGKCRIRAVTAGPRRTGNIESREGRIYVYAVEKFKTPVDYSATPVSRIDNVQTRSC